MLLISDYQEFDENTEPVLLAGLSIFVEVILFSERTTFLTRNRHYSPINRTVCLLENLQRVSAKERYIDEIKNRGLFSDADWGK